MKIAWSSCSRFIAVGLDGVTEILDGATLERLHTFPHPSGGMVRLLSFSSDSRSLMRLSDGDNKLTTWDLQTGGRISVIPSTPNTPLYHSSVCSMDGEMVAVAHTPFNSSPVVTGISIYNLVSRTHTYSRVEGRIVASIWTHGKFLRFVTVKPGSITIWEVGFTSKDMLAEIESLPAPDNIGPEECLFLPALSRLAFIFNRAVLVWDARDSKFLLNFVCRSRSEGFSFSSDGRFFACVTTGQGIHIWKESPTGYVLHQQLVLGTETYWTHDLLTPLPSPNGESILISKLTDTHLWRTTDPITSAVPTQPPTDFILEFSPDRSLAAAARLGDKAVTILDLKSGDPQLIIDTGMRVYGLGVTGNTVAVVGEGKIITWDLPTGGCVLDARANIHDSVRTIAFDHPALPPIWLHFALISPDFNCIAITRERGLDFYDTSTGKHLVGAENYGTSFTNRERLWFTRDGHELWFSGVSYTEAWKIIKDGKSGVIGLEHLSWDAGPSGGYIWESSHGHDVEEDGWILDSRKTRLMWLPHRWRIEKEHRIWNGRFLGLLDRGLPEPVILELDE